MYFQDLGKTIFYIGIFLVVIALILMYIKNVPFIGKLPGDIYIKKENFSFYFPITTCIIISVVLSLILYLLKRK
jgi:hypothetical protein